MSMGVATANSNLVVGLRGGQSRTRRPGGRGGRRGFSRFRPVLMTALAMIIGMVPMALGFGEGGEKNAPLGRAVIGGAASRRWRRCSSCGDFAAACTAGRSRRRAAISGTWGSDMSE